jgi:CubicO group peptidase (beta-lactamase class C family)
MKVLLLILSFISFHCASSKDETATAKKMNDFLTGQAKYFRFNGNVLVAQNGNIITKGSYGFADFDSKRLLNDSSVFELASVSKQFTATGILLLKDKGKLKLTDSLRQYFPELPYHNISIWHMLTHTSGLPDYFGLMIEKWDHSKIAFNNDMIAFLVKENPPVVFAPGTKWEYSNTAYVILASIIEKISGQTFREYMATNIFEPLQMRHTRIYNTRRSSKDSIANYAFGYGYNDSLKSYILPDNDPNANFVVYLDGLQGDGIVNSTTLDLLKWDRAVKNHALLTKETQEEMLKEQAMYDTLRKRYYGYGVMLEKNELGNIISHSGGWPGYVTCLARNIDKDQTYVVLSNNMSGSSSIALALQNIAAGNEVLLPYEHKRISLDTTALELFTGKFKLKAQEFTIERRSDKLFMVRSNNTSVELIPESATKLFYANGTDNQFEFDLDKSEKIKNAWIISTGLKTAVEIVQK